MTSLPSTDWRPIGRQDVERTGAWSHAASATHAPSCNGYCVNRTDRCILLTRLLGVFAMSTTTNFAFSGFIDKSQSKRKLTCCLRTAVQQKSTGDWYSRYIIESFLTLSRVRVRLIAGFYWYTHVTYNDITVWFDWQTALCITTWPEIVTKSNNQTRLTAAAAAPAGPMPPLPLVSAATTTPNCIGSECDDEVTAAVWVRQLPGKIADSVECRLWLRQRRRQRRQRRRHPSPWQLSAQPLRVKHQQARLKDFRKRAETSRQNNIAHDSLYCQPSKTWKKEKMHKRYRVTRVTPVLTVNNLWSRQTMTHVPLNRPPGLPRRPDPTQSDQARF